MRRPITRLLPQDLTCERVQRFLQHIEQERHNHIRTRNHRLAALHTFFDYLAHRAPEMLGVCEQVAAIPVKHMDEVLRHALAHPQPEEFLREPSSIVDWRIVETMPPSDPRDAH